MRSSQQGWRGARELSSSRGAGGGACEGSTEGASQVLMGRGACSKWDQTQLCAHHLQDVCWVKDPFLLLAMPCRHAGQEPLSPGTSQGLGVSSACSFLLWRRQEENKTTTAKRL